MINNFTPLSALIGGLIIGLSASAMLLVDGKVAGISGIFGGVLTPAKGDTAWRVCFVGGLLAGGLLLRVLLPQAFAFGMARSWVVLAAAGVLVGYGTRLGSGCTSGHGVCGVSRMSARSIVATLTFIAAGAVVVFITNHLLKGSL